MNRKIVVGPGFGGFSRLNRLHLVMMCNIKVKQEDETNDKKNADWSSERY